MTLPLPDLHERIPAELSSRNLLTRRGLLIAGLVALAVAGLSITLPGLIPAALVGAAAVLYAAVTIDRNYLLFKGIRNQTAIVISDDEARAIADADLPVYTILLPVFNEPAVLDTLLAGVGRLDYPADKLEILLLVEDDDEPTWQALAPDGVRTTTIPLGDKHVDIVAVPYSEPRTKPKACNYGMYTRETRGEFVTIYDAEDIPDPLQLRKAVIAFRQQPGDVACIQAKLGYFNEKQNLLTRWFSLEYDQWFGLVLPALQQACGAVPLGGTSNHMPTHMWREIGGWDEYNVTEDADLGVRLARHGFRTMVLDSTTLEEANSDVVNWIRQRSRWYKGYLQTMLVHLRHPAVTRRQLGSVATLRIISTTGGVALTSAITLLFWFTMVVWVAGRPEVVQGLFPAVTYYICLALLIVGNAMSIFVGLIVASVLGKPFLWSAALLAPLYWILQSIAAVKAILQLIFRPYYWEKTVHGLTESTSTVTPIPTGERT